MRSFEEFIPEVLPGFKGSTFLDTGYIFTPYTPMVDPVLAMLKKAGLKVVTVHRLRIRSFRPVSMER